MLQPGQRAVGELALDPDRLVRALVLGQALEIGHGPAHGLEAGATAVGLLVRERGRGERGEGFQHGELLDRCGVYWKTRG